MLYHKKTFPVPLVEEQALPDVKEVFEDTNVVNLLKSDKPTLILLQVRLLFYYLIVH